MKVLKVFLAVILSFLLLCAQCALMGVIACNEAISSDSIAKAVQETDFTNQISQQALDAASRQADENADEKVSEFLNEAMQTDAASEFIGQYTASAIQSALQGENFSHAGNNTLRLNRAQILRLVYYKPSMRDRTPSDKINRLCRYNPRVKEIINFASQFLFVFEHRRAGFVLLTQQHFQVVDYRPQQRRNFFLFRSRKESDLFVKLGI